MRRASVIAAAVLAVATALHGGGMADPVVPDAPAVPIPGGEDCTTLDGSAWVNDEEVMLGGLTVVMYVNATGEAIDPTVEAAQDGTQTFTVCFPNASFDVPTIVNDVTYAAEYAAFKIQNDAANAADQAARDAAELEIATNPLCSGSLDDVLAKVEAEVDLKAAVVKLARCVAARSTLGK